MIYPMTFSRIATITETETMAAFYLSCADNMFRVTIVYTDNSLLSAYVPVGHGEQPEDRNIAKYETDFVVILDLTCRICRVHEDEKKASNVDQ